MQENFLATLSKLAMLATLATFTTLAMLATFAVDALQACIRDIRTWMVQDKLELNDAKTEFLIIGTCAQLNKIPINDLQVGEVKVSAVYSVRNLGAWFDHTY